MKLQDIIRKRLGIPFLQYIIAHKSEHIEKELEKDYRLFKKPKRECVR